MAFSDKQKTLSPPPASAHRLPFHHHHHHRCLQISPHCPLHNRYLLPPNSHHDYRMTAHGRRHHHHHLELSPDCPLHGNLLPHCPLHSSNFHSNNQPVTRFPITPNFSSNPNLNNLNSIRPEADTNCNSESLVMHDRNAVEEEDDDDDEEEVIFVLTDEWKEFFAKSEAKRRLAKKQAKKKGKD